VVPAAAAAAESSSGTDKAIAVAIRADALEHAASERKTKSLATPAQAQSVPRTTLAQTGFTLHWVHELHWRQNPFTQLSVKPAHVFIVNQDAARQQINLFFIKEKQFGVIHGPPGSGKTFMLTWLAEELQPYGDRFMVYGFEGNAPTTTIIEKLVAPHQTLFHKYKGSTPEELSAFLLARSRRKMVILVDNADELTDQTAVYYKFLLAHNNAIVILTGAHPPALAREDMSVPLPPLHAKDVLKILERRISAVGGSGYLPFVENLVEELWRASGNNLKRFFEYCNETAMKVALKQLTITQPMTHEEKEEEPAAPARAQVAQGKSRAPAPVIRTSLKERAKTTHTKTQPEPAKVSHYDDLIAELAK
jgi:type II secretory pathway predicted ATPase ExeA